MHVCWQNARPWTTGKEGRSGLQRSLRPLALKQNGFCLFRPQKSPAEHMDCEGQAKRYWTGYNYMNATDGFPALKPPFWILRAYDLNEGSLKWQIPVGEIPEVVARGIRHTGSIPTRHD